MLTTECSILNSTPFFCQRLELIQAFSRWNRSKYRNIHWLSDSDTCSPTQSPCVSLQTRQWKCWWVLFVTL